jgi:hypothetical protein
VKAFSVVIFAVKKAAYCFDKETHVAVKFLHFRASGATKANITNQLLLLADELKMYNSKLNNRYCKYLYMVDSAFIYKHECPSRKGERLYADNIFIVKPLAELLLRRTRNRWEGHVEIY